MTGTALHVRHFSIYIQGVTGPHRQSDRDDRPCKGIIFCEGTYTRKHVVYELCAGEAVRP